MKPQMNTDERGQKGGANVSTDICLSQIFSILQTCVLIESDPLKGR